MAGEYDEEQGQQEDLREAPQPNQDTTGWEGFFQTFQIIVQGQQPPQILFYLEHLLRLGPFLFFKGERSEIFEKFG